MTLKVAHDDARLSWQGAVSLEHTEEWTQPWRIPHEERNLYNAGLVERASTAAGVRLSFHSDTTQVCGTIEGIAEPGGMDLCCNGEYVASIEIEGRSDFAFRELPAERKLIELWLPQKSRFRLKSLELSDGADLAPFEDERPKWITYGSSITHCGAAESPTRTWPGIVARGHGLNLICLGFGGNCHLDPLVARLIRDLPADFISVCAGINIHGSGSLNIRSFRQAVIGAVKIIREKHPEAPFVFMSPFCSPPRETTPNAARMTLEIMREEIATAVELLRGHGDDRLYCVNGLDIMGEDLAHLLPDDVHPNAEGYKILGRNFLERAARRYFL